MTTIYKTLNGARCVPTGGNGSQGLVIDEAGAERIRMQMLPVHPQRFEFIRKDRLVATEETL